LRLYLPESWAKDAGRRAKTSVPEDVSFRPKWKIALAEVRRIREQGVTFGTLLADAGYGVCAEFRRGLTEMGLQWAVGIGPEQKMYPLAAHTRPIAIAKRMRGHPARTASLAARRGPHRQHQLCGLKSF
jgi:SRSO17 transposase